MLVDVERLVKVLQGIAGEAFASGDGVRVEFHAYNDGQAIFFAYPRTPDRAAWHAGLTVMARSITCDALAVVSDSYASTSQTKQDGSAWEMGDMEYAWEHDTADKATLSEALSVMLVDRLGNATFGNLPYLRSGNRVEWEEPRIASDGVDGNEAGGGLIQTMRAAMTGPTVIDTMRAVAGVGVAADLGMDDEEMRIHAMCAGAKMLAEHEFDLAIGVLDDEYRDVLRRSFEGLRGL